MAKSDVLNFIAVDIVKQDVSTRRRLQLSESESTKKSGVTRLGIVNLIFAANTCAGEIGGKPPVLADHPISTRLMLSTALPLPCSRLRTAPV
jgi:hypothetical protein